VIDWDKPYGIICGIGAGGRKFSQDGNYYSAKGELVVPEAPEAPEAPEESFEDVVLDMVAGGMSHTDIAQSFGITRQKVTSTIRRAAKK